MPNGNALAVSEKPDEQMVPNSMPPKRPNYSNKCVIKSQDMPSEMTKTAIEVAVMVRCVYMLASR